MLTIRTDLAVEAHQLWRRQAGENAALPGVAAGEESLEGLAVTHVEILDETGARALGKPVGRYFTLDVSALWRREEDAPRRCAQAAAKLLAPLLPEEGPILVAGLGNRAMTPDALGPRTADQLLVTRHLGQLLPDLRPVAALAAGVCVVLVAGSFLYQKGDIGFDGLLVSFALISSSFGPVIALSNLGSTLQSTFAAAGRVFDILDESPAIEENTTGKNVSFNGVTADNISFSYNKENLY